MSHPEFDPLCSGAQSPRQPRCFTGERPTLETAHLSPSCSRLPHPPSPEEKESALASPASTQVTQQRGGLWQSAKAPRASPAAGEAWLGAAGASSGSASPTASTAAAIATCGAAKAAARPTAAGCRCRGQAHGERLRRHGAGGVCRPISGSAACLGRPKAMDRHGDGPTVKRVRPQTWGGLGESWCAGPGARRLRRISRRSPQHLSCDRRHVG